MPDSTISGLPELTAPSPESLIPIVHLGNTLKVQVQNLREGLPIASQTDKGLFSASDKVLLDTTATTVAALASVPRIATVASAPTIHIPNDVEVIVITGGTNIASVLSAEPYKLYTFHYPAGPGVELFGTYLTAGDSIVATFTP